MELWLLIQAFIQGVVEGLTEFLPISSTGHLIVSGALIGFEGEKANVFNIVIQSGAIVAVLFVYRQRLIDTVLGLASQTTAQRFALNVIVAFLPAALLGVLFSDYIKAFLFRPETVAAAFILGGVIMIWAEKRQHVIRVSSVDDMQIRDALKVGLAQCFALIPGTSRSGATIIGSLLFGFSRQTATEFSFFLAIPTIIGATVYDGYKARDLLSLSDWPMFTVGFITAFVSAWIAVHGLLKFVSNHSFIALAWYRIVFGFVILLTAWMGWINWHQVA